MEKEEYAIYKGNDDLIFIGTIEECMKYFNVKKKTVQWWSYNSAFKRAHTKNKKKAGQKWATALWKE